MGRKKKDSEQSAERAVAPDYLVSLVSESAEAAGKRAKINGPFGARVKEATENGHLHRKAYGVVCAMDKMDEFRRNDFIRSVQLYIDIMTEKRWSRDGHAGDLVDTAEEQDDDAEAAERNAAALEAGIKPLVPEAEFDDATSSKPSRRRASGVGEALGTTRVQ